MTCRLRHTGRRAWWNVFIGTAAGLHVREADEPFLMDSCFVKFVTEGEEEGLMLQRLSTH